MTLLTCLLLAVLQTPAPDEAAATTGSIPETLAKEVMPQYQRLSPTLAIAGQPSADALTRLRELGFETVINLRAASEPGVVAEEAVVRGTNLRYLSIPVTPETLTWETARALREALADPAAGRTLLHCSSSNRVGGLLALLAREDGADTAAALEQGRARGLQPGKMMDAVTRLLESR